MTAECPMNVAAERSVLGVVLLQPALLTDLRAAGLRMEHFSLDAHRCIYRALLTMHDRDVPADLICLADELRRQGDLDAIGGCAYLSDLTTGAVPVKKHVLHHAAIVIAKARLRWLAQLGARLQEEACQPGADPDEVERLVAAKLGRAR